MQFHPLLVSKGPQATGLKRRRGRREEKSNTKVKHFEKRRRKERRERERRGVERKEK